MDKCFKCKGTGIIPGSIPALDKPCDACRKPSPAPKAGNVLREALEQLRALEAAGEDPRNAHQLYDITPEQAGALLAHLDDVAGDAEKWRALQACARIRMMGCAGVHPESPDFATPYAHIGMEFWTHHSAHGDPSDVQGREWFDKFMDKALAAYRAALAPAQEASDGK